MAQVLQMFNIPLVCCAFSYEVLESYIRQNLSHGVFFCFFFYKGKILTIPLWIIISSTKLPPFGEMVPYFLPQLPSLLMFKTIWTLH